MNKRTLLAALVALGSLTATAGGLLTNSNQNAAFLRQMSQDGIIDITSIYANPAGGAFLSDGWHLSLNIQSAIQERNITTDYSLFQYNKENPSTSRKFKGEATAPVVPSVTLSYNRPKWSVSMHFAVAGGGGKCEFDDGIGSIESTYAGMIYSAITGQITSTLMGYGYDATTAGALATSAYDGYTLDSYMKGRSFHYGLQFGATYKFTPRLAGYAGLRGIIARCHYEGYAYPTASYTLMGSTVPVDLSAYNVSLDCDQKAFGVTPIIGMDFRINDKWNIGAKFEGRTRINLKNSTDYVADATVKAAASSILGQFEDGKKVREDVPTIVTMGVQYSPIKKVHLAAAFHEYFDKQAKRYEDKQDLIDHNTWELNASCEWDICKVVTVSGSWQTTQYGLSDEYMNDISFNLPNHMIGAGVRIRPTKKVNIDVAYMHTFYSTHDVVTSTISNHYERKNDVVAVGVNLDF